jgi:hypothetical protein
LTGVVVHVDTGAYRRSTLAMTQIEADVAQRLRQAGIVIGSRKHHDHTANKAICG